MNDDVKVILAEYRLALKKNNSRQVRKIMKNTSYIGISLIILIFGIIFIPKIVDRVSNNDVVKSDRLNVNKKTRDPGKMMYIEQYGEKKKVPEFSFVNQDGDTISNEDYLGKVYVIEFFFTTCPSICPIMNRNLVEIQDEFRRERIWDCLLYHRSRI
jgi:protein SCO1